MTSQPSTWPTQLSISTWDIYCVWFYPVEPATTIKKQTEYPFYASEPPFTSFISRIYDGNGFLYLFQTSPWINLGMCDEMNRNSFKRSCKLRKSFFQKLFSNWKQACGQTSPDVPFENCQSLKSLLFIRVELFRPSKFLQAIKSYDN